jgi:hypothetical protein
MKYCLINEQEWFIRFKATSAQREWFRPNKPQPASLLNSFKHDYKFNTYTALLVFFI